MGPGPHLQTNPVRNHTLVGMDAPSKYKGVPEASLASWWFWNSTIGIIG